MNTIASQPVRRLLVLVLLALALLSMVLPVMGQPPEPAPAPESGEELAEFWQSQVPGNIDDNLIPIVAILSVFGIPPVAILLLALLFFRYREKQQRLYNDRLQRFLEAGQPIPEELLKNEVQENTPTQHLNTGMTWLGLGIGLGIFLGLMAGWEVASLALIPIGLGIAKLISWKLSSRSPQD